MKLFYCDHHELPLPDGHHFPVSKYRRLRHRISTADWSQKCELIPAPAVTDAQLEFAHTRDYLDRVRGGQLTEAEQRALGFPWSAQLVERCRRSTGATIGASRCALTDGASASLAGGTHHAFADRGEGFCMFNDTVVAARTMQQEHGVGRVIVIDCDVHQGNGTAAITHDDPSIFSYSIHGRRNYPLRKEVSDLDVPLEDGTSDAAYLDALAESLPAALETSRPSLAFYIAGADPFADDRYGRMQLSKLGLAARDDFVLDQCGQRRIPVATVLGGGYARRVEDVVDIHEATLKRVYSHRESWSSLDSGP